MQEMPYEYGGGDGGWKRRFEITIPILLLILVLLVVSWKLGWLAGIPVIGDWFKSPNIDILVIGNDATLVQTLETQIKGELPINVFTVNVANLSNILTASTYNKYSMIIMTEGDAGDTIALPSLTLDHIKTFVDSGKPAIVIMNAGTKIVGDNQAKGWTRLDFVPVECSGLAQISCDKTPVPYTQVELQIKKDSSIVQEYGIGPLTFTQGTIEFTSVAPKSGDSILSAKITVGTSEAHQDALVERTTMLGGKVVYFAFHPSYYPSLLKNTIKYLR